MLQSEDAYENSHLSDEEEFIGYTGESSGSYRPSHHKKDQAKEPKITIANVSDMSWAIVLPCSLCIDNTAAGELSLI